MAGASSATHGAGRKQLRCFGWTSLPRCDSWPKLGDEPSRCLCETIPFLSFLQHLYPQVGFSTGQPVYNERGVSQRMLSFMENFYLIYPDLLDVPLFLVC